MKSLIGQTAQLNFQIVHGCTQDQGDCIENQKADLETKIKAAEVAGAYTKDSFTRFSEYRDRINTDLKANLPADTFVAFEKQNDPNEVTKTIYSPVLLSSKDVFSESLLNKLLLKSSDGRSAMSANRPEVAFQINSAAVKSFEEFTGKFVGHYMAIVLDGVVKSSPVLQSAIGDSGRITLGSGSYDCGKRLKTLRLSISCRCLACYDRSSRRTRDWSKYGPRRH